MRNILLILILLTAGVFANKSSAQAVILRADTVEVPCISTDTFLVPVYLDNLVDGVALQFSLHWDTTQLDYAFITMLHPQFQGGAAFDTIPATGAISTLSFVWTNNTGVTLPPNTVLFKVGFSRIGTGPQTPVRFTNFPTDIFAFDSQGNTMDTVIHHGAVKPLDSIGPTITCPMNVDTGWSSPIPIPNIAPIVSDNCGMPLVGWSSVGATVVPFTNDPDASGSVFDIGLTTVTYKTTDAGGNTATCSFNILIEFSVSTNDLTLIANPNNAASCGETVTIDVLAFNFDSVVGLQYSMEWLPIALEYLSITNINPVFSPSDFGTLDTDQGQLSFVWSGPLGGVTIPDGTTLFTLTYTVLGPGTIEFGDDPTLQIAFGGLTPEQITLITLGATIAVSDTVAPTIVCPADTTVVAPGTTAVQGIAPTVDDNCAAPFVAYSVTGATTISGDIDASGALFNLGVNTVTYTTTDAGGNSASCSFNLTVEFGINTTDLTIIANNVNADCGGSFGIDVTALNFETIAALQFSMHWDTALVQYTSVTNFNNTIGIGPSEFGVDSVGVGFITFAWNSTNLNGSSVNNGDVLFRLNFNLLNNTSSTIDFSGYTTLINAFDGGTFDSIAIVTVNGQISVVDTVPPSITCPSDTLVNAPSGQLFALINGLEPTTLSDNCGGIPSLTYTQTGATTNPSGTGNANGNYDAGTTVVTYTATDANANFTTCSFQVVVDAGTPLVIQVDTLDLGCQGVPAQITVNVSVDGFTDLQFVHFWLNWDPAVLEFDTVGNDYPGVGINAGTFFSYQDVATGLLKFFKFQNPLPNIPQDGILFSITFNVLNAAALSGLTFSGPIEGVNTGFLNVPVITIDGVFLASTDNVPPVVTCPSDTILNAPALACDADYTPPAPTATDACGVIGNITFSPAISVFPAGVTQVTYTVADDSGNSSTCSYNVTVLENNPPQVTGCPTSPILVNANALCQGNAVWTPPTFMDVCGQALDTIINDYDPGGLFAIDTTLVNYTATDMSGNQTTCSFLVVVRDVTAPSVICPADTVITPASGCSAIVHYNIVATDNCDATLTFICSDTSGTLFSGITPVICAILDDANNVANCSFSVTVIDAAAPLFPDGCPSDTVVISASGNCGANPTWQTPLVTDDCTASITPTPSQGPGTFFDVLNSPHTVVYTATDGFGNTATCSFTVTVADSTNPVLANCPTLPIVKVLPIDSCLVTLSWTPPTVSDNCGAGMLTLTSNLTPGLFPTGDTMVVYTATDASGNVTTCSFNISVKDVVPPTFIDCPTQPIVVLNGNPCGNEVDFTFPTGMDNCTPEPELVYTSSFMPNDTFIIGTTQFPVRVTDASGLFEECLITITVMGQAATLTNIPADTTVIGCDTQVSWGAPMPVGFCPPITVTSTHTSGSVFPFGTTTVIYTASDSIGNVATASFNITVTENVAPVFNCPFGPIVVNMGGVIVFDSTNFLFNPGTTPGCDGVQLSYNLPNATDNCVTPTVSLTQGLASGSIFPLGFNPLVFQAVDSSGNMVQCVVVVQVDSLPELRPVVDPITGCAGGSVVITTASIPGAIYTWTGPVTSTTNVLTISSLNAQNSGQYIVSANVNGCILGPDTSTVFMAVSPMAENDLNYSIDPGATLTFPSVFVNDILTPAFDFGIDTTTFLEGLNMNYNDGTFSYTAGETPGTASFSYKVCSRSCPSLCDEAVVTITIRDTECAFIPNIITPNGDPVNEYFVIPCIETRLFNENSLVVYSQWGDKVFEASPYLNDWNGTLENQQGKNLPDGVYFYIFKPGPNIPPLNGFVEVFR